jgi:hypothetical protein
VKISEHRFGRQAIFLSRIEHPADIRQQQNLHVGILELVREHEHRLTCLLTPTERVRDADQWPPVVGETVSQPGWHRRIRIEFDVTSPEQDLMIGGIECGVGKTGFHPSQRLLAVVTLHRDRDGP